MYVLGTGPRIVVKHVLPKSFGCLGADGELCRDHPLHPSDGNAAADVQRVMAPQQHSREADGEGPAREQRQGDDGANDRGRVIDAEEERQRDGSRRVAWWEGEFVWPDGEQHLALIVAGATTTCEGLAKEREGLGW